MKKQKTNYNTKYSSDVFLKHVVLLFSYLLIVWGFYRFLFRLPEEIEEFLIKPAIWLVPVFYFVRKEKLGLGSLGITWNNYTTSVYLALALGVVFAIEGVVINLIKYNGIEFAANIGTQTIILGIIISLATAVSEEITFRGYMLTRLNSFFGNPYIGMLISTFLFALIHLPVNIFWFALPTSGIIGIFLLSFVFGIGSSFVFMRTKNIVASILLHVMWAWPIILFR